MARLANLSRSTLSNATAIAHSRKCASDAVVATHSRQSSSADWSSARLFSTITENDLSSAVGAADPSPFTAATAASEATRNASDFGSRYSYMYDAESVRGRLVRLRDPIVPHAVSPRRTVAREIPVPRPSYASTGRVLPSLHPDQILIHGPASIERMSAAARLARRVLDYACSLAEPGVSTDEIDAAVHRAILTSGAYPSPLNYAGFPKSLCSSVNEVICHGIPDGRKLSAGDVVSFDVSCYLGGVHGDNCATVIVGDRDGVDDDYCDDVKGDAKADASGNLRSSDGTVTTPASVDWRGVRQRSTFSSPEQAELFISARRLVQAAKESLDAAVLTCRPGGCLTEVGAAVHAVADAYGYDTVRKYRGHGIGEEFHCSPFVKHYRNSERVELVPGMIFTIEPMITEGSAECTEWDDDWTVVTLDGGRAAQFEHTVLITEEGVRVLTVPE